MNDVAILERARLGFVGIADQIDRLLFVRLDEAPFHSAGKTGAAASAQPGSLDFVHDVGARHGDRFLQLLVAAVVQVAVDVDRPIFAADVFEDEPALERMRRGDCGSRIGVADCEEDRRRDLGSTFSCKLIVDHADRRGAATGETFDEFDAVFPSGLTETGLCIPLSSAWRSIPQARAEILHDLVTARHRATQGCGKREYVFCPAGACRNIG